MSRQSDYITHVRAANKAIWDGINTLFALQREWNALDYGNTLSTGEGENTGIDAADVGAVAYAPDEAATMTTAEKAATFLRAVRAFVRENVQGIEVQQAQAIARQTIIPPDLGND